MNEEEFRIQNTEFRIQNTEFRIQNLERRILNEIAADEFMGFDESENQSSSKPLV